MKKNLPTSNDKRHPKSRLLGGSSAKGAALGVCLWSTLVFSPSASAISISLDFGISGNGLSASQQIIFNEAADIWETLLTGYQPGISILGPTIKAESFVIDGAGGILGSAGPTVGTLQGGFLLATAGIMQFDTADLANLELNGSLKAVVTHEIAHILGFGTLWSFPITTMSGTTIYNPVYNGAGHYIGAHALAAYRAEFDKPLATFVPVELGGGPGTAHGHWNEVDGGAGLTGIVDASGHDFRNELMTGWLNSPTFISQTTIHSFEDIGFTVATVADGTSTLFLLVGAMVVIQVRRRRGHASP